MTCTKSDERTEGSMRSALLDLRSCYEGGAQENPGPTLNGVF
jgi:hypothetical protein